MTRAIAFNAAAGYLKKGVTIEKFMPLPWDNKTKKIEPLNKGRYQEIISKTKNLINGTR